ncbi:phosphotransferase enzyme family protein [Paenibacillus glycanilyticus]|uniref:Homoserine kinase n=1 Tax=Paenibacillus glycanilyticus TaxID=126569 RepID=A0ABQ6GBI2_9BACL|nr:phosphotransferase [Paenibacillus glycanilyticus]GLX68007.1 homoserine kinase [Paenibacillus glycanilyticus]
MNSGFQMDTDINRRLTLKQTKQAALYALQKYDVDWSSIHFIQVSEHATFRIHSITGESYLLRVHALNKSYVEVNSELRWLAHLRSKGLVVPDGVLNRNGEFITVVSKEDKAEYYATLMRWIEGDRLDKNALNEDHIRAMGKLMADLHGASVDFVPGNAFSRTIWGSESFALDWKHLQKHHNHFITKEAFKLYTEASAKVADQLQTYTPHAQNYGIIHADLHNGNIVFCDDLPYAIDFGRCGFGYHIYDIAQAVMGLRPHQRKLFIEGYEKVRQLSNNTISMLECFFIMAIIEAYSFHAENEQETEGLIEEQPYAQSILRAFMNGEPFLFREFDEY